MLKCDRCGEEKPDVEVVADPFMSDVWDEVVMVQLCDECSTLVSDEI